MKDKQQFDIGTYFTIQYYADKHSKTITRRGKWTDKCREFVAKKGHACLTYFDLDADSYRMATNKITDWSIK